MRLTGKDAVTTLYTGVIIALDVAFPRGTDIPAHLQRTRTAAVILIRAR